VAGEVRGQRVEPVRRRELLRQLPMATRYKVTSGGQILLLPKDEVKKELGCSPDDADSYVMGIYGLRFVRPAENKRDAYSEQHEPDHDFRLQVA
jgi:hypothetical protein